MNVVRQRPVVDDLLKWPEAPETGTEEDTIWREEKNRDPAEGREGHKELTGATAHDDCPSPESCNRTKSRASQAKMVGTPEAGTNTPIPRADSSVPSSHRRESSTLAPWNCCSSMVAENLTAFSEIPSTATRMDSGRNESTTGPSGAAMGTRNGPQTATPLVTRPRSKLLLPMKLAT